MARIPKVWGGIVHRSGFGGGHHHEARVIVKATTARRARELLAASAVAGPRPPTPNEWSGWWAETGNEAELAVSAHVAEGVWYSPGRAFRVEEYKADPGRIARCATGCSPICAKCCRNKAPVGRSIAPAMAGVLCDDACEGYRRDPKPCDLWPGEARS